MPELAGLIDTRSGHARPVLDAMLDRLRPARPHRAVRRDVERCSLGHLQLDLAADEGGVAHAAGVELVLCGAVRFLDRHGAPAAAGEARVPSRHQPLPDTAIVPDSAARCLELYLENGIEALTGLDGIYALAVWDSRDEALHLVQDLLGFAGLVIHRHQHGLAFATRPRALAALVGHRIDPAGLVQALTIGHPIGEQTLFRGVASVPAGQRLVWRDGTLHHHDVATPTLQFSGDLDDAAAELHAAIGEAVAGARAGAATLRPVLPLSGGLDSRMLLGYLRAQPGLVTVSYGHHHSRDLRYGRRLAAVAGVENRPILLREDYMTTFARQLVRTTDGDAAIHAAHLYCMQPVFEEAPSILFSGLLGDVLTGKHLHLPGTSLDDDAPATDAGRRLFEGSYRLGFTDDELRRLLRPRFREGIGADLEAFLTLYATGTSAIDRVRRARLERQRRFTAYQLAVCGETCVVRAPFTGPRILALCSSIPADMQVGQRLYRHVLCRYHEDLARVPRTSDRMPLLGSKVAMAVRRHVEQARWQLLPRLTRGHLRPHDYRQYAHYDAWIRSANRDLFAGALSSEALAEIVDPGVARALLDDHLAGRRDIYNRLCALATLALVLELHGAGAADEPPRSGSDLPLGAL